jgi:hypothetical protein
VGGKPCYKVVVTPFNLPQQILFFDKESRLLVKASMTIETRAGAIPFESYLSDYKRADRILTPRKNVKKVMGQERIVTVDSIEQNVALPADRFAMPPEIKALIKKNQ